MGWWETPENKNLIIGDDVLDITRHFLRDFSKTYQNALNRKPSLEELQYVLSLGFKVNIDDEILLDFDDKEIKQVALKTAKRAKRQKPIPGDIFCFRFDENRFGFGRVVSQIFIGLVVEIFDYFSEQPVFDYSKLSEWLFDPIIIDGYSLFERRLEGDWRIIGQTPDYKPQKELENIQFVFGGTPDTLKSVDIFDNKKPIDPQKAKDLPQCIAKGDCQVIKVVKEALEKN